jgi:hypothetical protein
MSLLKRPIKMGKRYNYKLGGNCIEEKNGDKIDEFLEETNKGGKNL